MKEDTLARKNVDSKRSILPPSLNRCSYTKFKKLRYRSKTKGDVIRTAATSALDHHSFLIMHYGC